jgi:uncharacterized protein YjbI with pentapeptide repeats
LMMLALLARTAAEFDKQLRTTLPGEPEQERYRAQIGNALFLQLLVGMKGERTGVNALLMGLIALITIVLAPLATLVLMQMMFLPYHHLRITWWHRGIVVADLVLIVVMTYRCFFPRGARKMPLVLGALSRKPRWAMAMAFCVLQAVVLAPIVDWLSFQEGRWAGEPPPSLAGWRWWAGEPPPFPETFPDYEATANGVVFGLFPDRLNLASETIVGKEKLERTKQEIASRAAKENGSQGQTDFVPTINLDGRDLQAAVLSGADLRGVALRGAFMNGVILDRARLDGANLGPTQGDVQTRLQGAELFGAHLQGANLSSAQLQGVDLSGSEMQGADLSYAELQGAEARSARLQGADLSNAQLQGAQFSGSSLQGADLHDAQLQGSNFDRAQKHGAQVERVDAADSEFHRTFVFRTNITDARLDLSAFQSVSARPRWGLVDPWLGDFTHRLTPEDINTWVVEASRFASDGVSQRFDVLKSDFRTTSQDSADGAKWKSLEDASHLADPDGSKHRSRLAKVLGDLACNADGAPYVARSLIGRGRRASLGRLSRLGDQLEDVRARIMTAREKPNTCMGVMGFTEKDWSALDAIKPD